MEQFASTMNFTLVKLPATKGSRQSINVQLPTAILKNLPTCMAYMDSYPKSCVLFPRTFAGDICVLQHLKNLTKFYARETKIDGKFPRDFPSR